jgi:hypothetical protein
VHLHGLPLGAHMSAVDIDTILCKSGSHFGAGNMSGNAPTYLTDRSPPQKKRLIR